MYRVGVNKICIIFCKRQWFIFYFPFISITVELTKLKSTCLLRPRVVTPNIIVVSIMDMVVQRIAQLGLSTRKKSHVQKGNVSRDLTFCKSSYPQRQREIERANGSTIVPRELTSVMKD